MSTQIEGKVAAIIDDTTLVLNIGDEQGVEEGMAFAIFAAHGEIKDPDSGESLGSWEMVKARVVATHVQPRLCTVRAPIVGEAPVVGDTRTLSAMMVEHSVSLPKGAGEWQRLEVRGADISGRPQSQLIAVGDGARSLVEAEDEAPDVASGEAVDEMPDANGGEAEDEAPDAAGGEAEDAPAA